MSNFDRIGRVCGPSAREAFDEMRDQTPFLFPLLFVVLGTLILLAVVAYPSAFYLFNSLFDSLHQVGISRTYREQHFNIGGTRIDIQNGIWLTPMVVLGLVFEVFNICFNVGVRLMLFGTYFYAIARWLRIDTRWEHWFGLSCWANIPMIVVPSVVLIIGTIAVTQPVPKLVVFFLWVVFCVIPILWSVYISVQGLLSWTEKESAFCVKVALVPYVLWLLSYSPTIIASLFFNPFRSFLE